MLKLLLQIIFWIFVALGAIFAAIILPGWFLKIFAISLALIVALGVLEGSGVRWAKRVNRWLFWPH